MNNYYADLHIHIGGSSSGSPVKITASRKLTFNAIINECINRKGIDVAGIVDCAAPKIIKDIEELAAKDIIYELPEGGFIHKEKLLVILASEIETSEKNGRTSHHICYFPYLKNIKRFSSIMGKHITNIELSSQSSGLPAKELYDITLDCGGIPVPAHAFTPHKSIYGRVADSWKKIFSEDQFYSIPALELGLSADTNLADRKAELSGTSYLTSSDAHSASKIAREYTMFKMARLNFKEFSLALRRAEGRIIGANFGMDPRLGKYHRSYCKRCGKVAETLPPATFCPYCFSKDSDFIIGVLDRINMIADYNEPHSPDFRPPYFYQIPLEFVPGLSNNRLSRLIDAFGSEMAVIHNASLEELRQIVSIEIAENIIKARQGELLIGSGGGGKYGSVYRTKIEQLTFKI